MPNFVIVLLFILFWMVVALSVCRTAGQWWIAFGLACLLIITAHIDYEVDSLIKLQYPDVYHHIIHLNNDITGDNYAKP